MLFIPRANLHLLSTGEFSKSIALEQVEHLKIGLALSDNSGLTRFSEYLSISYNSSYASKKY